MAEIWTCLNVLVKGCLKRTPWDGLCQLMLGLMATYMEVDNSLSWWDNCIMLEFSLVSCKENCGFCMIIRRVVVGSINGGIDPDGSCDSMSTGSVGGF